MENELNCISENVPTDMRFESFVKNEDEGLMLLEMLANRFTYHTKEEWQKKISDKDVSVNDSLASEKTVVHRADKISYVVHNYKEPYVPTDFKVIFEDDEFLLIEKPAGVPIHHTGKIFYNTFTGIVRRALENEEITPMHRLDRDTGGLMLFAKYRDTASRFQKNLDKILLQKFYLALVPGDFPETFVCKFPLAEKKDANIRLQMFVSDSGKPCKTIFRKLKTYEQEIGNRKGAFSLVEAELVTGRKHQIRAHLAALGFPIVGDRIYSFGGQYYLKMAKETLTEADYQILGAKHQLLYAYKVKLHLPDFKEPRIFEIPFPDSWPVKE